MSQTQRGAVRVPTSSWWTQIVGGLFCIGVSAIAVLVSKPHAWSWTLFLWGLLIVPVWIAWATLLTRAMSNAIAKQASISVQEMASARSRFRWGPTYVGAALAGIALATASAGLDAAWPDVLLTIFFLLGGVVLPLALYPKLKRQTIERQANAGANRQPGVPD